MTKPTTIRPELKLGTYIHYKGITYYVTGLSLFCTNGENEDRWVVEYCNAQGDKFSRWYDDFFKVIVNTPRFTFLSDSPPPTP
jgi:hypothetical protein